MGSCVDMVQEHSKVDYHLEIFKIGWNFVQICSYF